MQLDICFYFTETQKNLNKNNNNQRDVNFLNRKKKATKIDNSPRTAVTFCFCFIVAAAVVVAAVDVL